MTEVFHPPIANNFVDMLIPRTHDATAYVHGIERDTSVLNRADEALLDYCSALLTRGSDREASDAVAHWRACIAKRANLQAQRWVPQVIAGLVRTGAICGSLHEHLTRDRPEILDLFRAAPRAVLEVVRVNGYLAPWQIGDALELLTREIVRGELSAAIDRVETARLKGSMSTDPGLRFPTLIVYLAPEVSVEAYERVVSTLSRASHTLDPRLEFAIPVAHNATLTQGFVLHKRYLRLVGLLDEFYDSNSNHAFCRDGMLGRGSNPV